jgi:hypothetical protein
MVTKKNEEYAPYICSSFVKHWSVRFLDSNSGNLQDLLFARLQSMFHVVCVPSDCLGLRHIDGKVEGRFTPELSFVTASHVSEGTRNDMTL